MTIYSMQVAFRYEFDRPAGAGRQLFRILPAVIPGIQTLLRAEVSIEPDPDETAEFRDFYGTRVIELVMPPGLSELELVLDAEVERIGHDPGLDISATLSHLPAEIAHYKTLDAASPHHFLAPTERIPPMPAVAAFARQATAKAATAREALEMLGAERLVYGHVGDSLFTVRLDATLVPPKVGDTVTLTTTPEHLHWFDAATTQRV